MSGSPDVEPDVAWRVENRARHLLADVGLAPAVAVESLSSGMKRRVLLGAVLVSDPDVLLLDEPTNHLDVDTIAWLEDFLGRWRATLVFVTHDRRFSADAGHAHSGNRPRPAVRLVVRLRDISCPQGSRSGGRGKTERAVRQKAGRGRSLDSPRDQGPPHTQRRPRPGTRSRCAGSAASGSDADRQSATRDSRRPAQRNAGGRGRRRSRSPTATQVDRRDFSTTDHARRQDRHHRPQRRGQDHAAAPAARPTAADHRARFAWERICKSPISISCAGSSTKSDRCKRTSATATKPFKSAAVRDT